MNFFGTNNRIKMKTRTVLGVIITILPFCFLGVILFFRIVNQEKSTQMSPKETVIHDNEIESQDSRSPEQKIAQLLAVSVRIKNQTPPQKYSGVSQEQWDLLLHLQPAMIVLYGSKLTFPTVQSSITDIQRITNSSLIALDHEGGMVQRLGTGFTPLEKWESFCKKDATYRTSRISASAQELHRAGVDVILGPVIDYSPQPAHTMSGRICSHSRETLLLSTRHAVSLYMQSGVNPTIKHFPGIGDVLIDLHYDSAQILSIDEVSLFFDLLNDFSELAVMTSHASLPGQEKPCSLSAACLDLLAAFPSTLIITDDIDMISSYQNDNQEQNRPDFLTNIARESFIAGNTVVLLGPDINSTEILYIWSALSNQYRTDPFFASVVDARLHVFDNWRARKSTQ